MGVFETVSAQSQLDILHKTNSTNGYAREKAESTIIFWRNLSLYPFTVDTSQVSWYKSK